MTRVSTAKLKVTQIQYYKGETTQVYHQYRQLHQINVFFFVIFLRHPVACIL
jgi:hypothetical protein